MSIIKKKILNLLLSKLFLAITEDELIPLKGLEDRQREEYAAQARLIRKSDVWKRLQTEIKHKAQKRMFEKSACWDDMFFGKAVLYVIELQDKRLEALSKIKS